MRVNRAKFVRKYLRFFRIVYGITPPYDIILDGNFIHAALKVKLDIRERLEKLLQGEKIRICVTKSVLKELSEAGPKTVEALQFAKKFCEIIDDDAFSAEAPSDRLKAMLGELWDRQL
jgi:U3 small nucleolar RNA-associated protein 23